jgi:protein-S-isoprenylcysteine O-methyltransferase Ste14
MNKSIIQKHILGYILGTLVFLTVIPFIIYLTSLISSGSLGLNVFPMKLIGFSLATLLAGTGMIFAIWSNIDLLIIGKGGPVDFFNRPISPRSKKLVTKGSYHYTRNPMVFGMNALYIASAIFRNSLLSLLFCLIFLSCI